MTWNAWKTAAVLTLLTALGVGAYAVTTGQARLMLILFVPVFYGTSGLGALSVLLVITAFILWIIGNFKALTAHTRAHDPTPHDAWPTTRHDPERRPPPHEPHDEAQSRTRTRIRGGGVIMLGPIPIILGTDKRLTLWLVLAALALTLAAVAFLLLAADGRP